MSAGPLPLPRRTALALGVAGIAVVSSCAEHTRDLAAAPAADQDLDGALVDRVLAELADADRLALAGGFTDLSAVHQAHIAALDGTPPTTTPTTTPTSTPTTPPAKASREAVLRRERALRTSLVDAALAAESGALARLLASMSAAVAQQLTTVPGKAR